MRKNLIAICCILATLSSCTNPRYIYSSSMPNNPFFTTKGESKLAAYYSGGPSRSSYDTSLHTKNRGVDLQAAYAIAKHWALTADYFTRQERDTYGTEKNISGQPTNDFFGVSALNYKRKLFGIGGGYFSGFNNGEKVSFNLYGGIAFGKFSFFDAGRDLSNNPYQRSYSNDIFKWRIQPSFNFLAGKNINLALIGAFSFAHYSNATTNYSATEMVYLKLNTLPGRTASFFEPAFNMEFRLPQYDWLKFEGSAGLTSGVKNSGLDSRGYNLSIGLSLDLSKIN